MFQVAWRAIVEAEIRLQFRQAAAALPGDFANHLPRLVGRHAADHRHARLDDSCLFSGDGRQRFAELLRVVEADARDDRKARRANVGRIEPAAKPHFHHGCPHAASGEMAKGHRRDDLEIGWTLLRGTIHRFDDRSHQVDQVGELVGRTRPPIDGHSFLDPIEMGRSEKSRSAAGRRERGRRHGRRRTLAFRAGHMNDGQLLVRIAQPAEQFPHAIELEQFLGGGHRLRPFVVDATGQESQGRLAARRGAVRIRGRSHGGPMTTVEHQNRQTTDSTLSLVVGHVPRAAKTAGFRCLTCLEIALAGVRICSGAEPRNRLICPGRAGYSLFGPRAGKDGGRWHTSCTRSGLDPGN